MIHLLLRHQCAHSFTIHLVTHSLNRHLLRAKYGPAIVLGFRDQVKMPGIDTLLPINLRSPIHFPVPTLTQASEDVGKEVPAG